MKKAICLWLALLTLFSFAHAEETDANPYVYSGYWLDSWSQRAYMTITYDGENHKAVIHWSGSAFEYIQWELSGQFENGVLTSDNCVKSSHFYSEDGTEEIVVHYQNEPASLTLTDGALLWTDSESMGENCRFELYTEIDMRDVYNPNHHAHLYVIGVSSFGETLYARVIPGTIHENRTTSGFDFADLLMLPLSPDCEITLPGESADLAAWFDAAEADSGFYAVFLLNEAGEIVKLAYNEDQPDAPAIPDQPEDQPEPAMIVPAPPSGK